MPRFPTFRRLLLMVLSGAVVVALAAAPAEAKKKKHHNSDDDSKSADSDSGSKKHKSKKHKSKDSEEAKSDDSDKAKSKDEDSSKSKKTRKEYSEDDDAPAKTAAPAKAAPAAKAATATPPPAPPPAAQPIAPPAAVAEVPPPPPADDLDTVISRTAGLGRLKLQHVNEITSFKLTKLAYDLNNHAIYPEPGKPDPDFNAKSIPIWEGVLPVGDNEIKVTAVYKGQGNFFAYLNDMTFVKTDTTKVKVTEGSVTTVTVVGEEDGSPFTQTEDRPRFDYRTEVSANKTAVIR